MCSISETKFKNILRTSSGWLLTKHLINKNWISLNPQIMCSYMRVFTVLQHFKLACETSPSDSWKKLISQVGKWININYINNDNDDDDG